jgi:hypothetical protein
MASVYALGDGRPDLHVEDVKLSLEDKVKARAALFAMVRRDQDLGLFVPPEILKLGQWLDAKVLSAERKQIQRSRDPEER